MIGTIHNFTAVFKKDYYGAFGIHPNTATLYGYPKDQIKNIKLKVSEDQTIPTITEEQADTTLVYWGWYKTDSMCFDPSMVFRKKFMLEMCFPNGTKVGEDRNEGKVYKLELVQ